MLYTCTSSILFCFRSISCHSKLNSSASCYVTHTFVCVLFTVEAAAGDSPTSRSTTSSRVAFEQLTSLLRCYDNASHVARQWCSAQVAMAIDRDDVSALLLLLCSDAKVGDATSVYSVATKKGDCCANSRLLQILCDEIAVSLRLCKTFASIAPEVSDAEHFLSRMTSSHAQLQVCDSILQRITLPTCT